MKELICIVCPKGCHIKVDGEHITGYSCERGKEYAIKETTSPTRVVTSTVKISGGEYPRVPVKTVTDIPKAKVFEVMKALDGIRLHAPVKMGDIALKDAAGTGVDVVVTKDM